MARDITHSPVPEDWEKMQWVTVIDPQENGAVNYAVLEKTGRVYYHLRYVTKDLYDAGGKWRPNSWTIQVPIAGVTLLGGHDQRIMARFRKWRIATLAHQNAVTQAFQGIYNDVQAESRQMQAARQQAWQEANPQPVRPRFFTRRNHPNEI